MSFFIENLPHIVVGYIPQEVGHPGRNGDQSVGTYSGNPLLAAPA